MSLIPMCRSVLPPLLIPAHTMMEPPSKRSCSEMLASWNHSPRLLHTLARRSVKSRQYLYSSVKSTWSQSLSVKLQWSCAQSRRVCLWNRVKEMRMHAGWVSHTSGHDFIIWLTLSDSHQRRCEDPHSSMPITLANSSMVNRLRWCWEGIEDLKCGKTILETDANLSTTIMSQQASTEVVKLHVHTLTSKAHGDHSSVWLVLLSN